MKERHTDREREREKEERKRVQEREKESKRERDWPLIYFPNVHKGLGWANSKSAASDFPGWLGGTTSEPSLASLSGILAGSLL